MMCESILFMLLFADVKMYIGIFAYVILVG